MKQVYAPANLAEAHMLAHMLEQNGVAAHVHGEALLGGVGELPAGGLLQLMVAKDDYDRTRALIAEWERSSASPADETTRKPRAPIWMGLIVFVIGVGGGWMLKTAAEQSMLPITSDEVRSDVNNDGSDDTIYSYRIGATYPFKGVFDLNFDGTMDATERYNASGATITRDADENGDGFVESHTTYTDANPIRTSIDRNRDGLPDIQVHFRNGVVSHEEIRELSGGGVVRVNYYANFLLNRSESDLDGDGFAETVRTYNEAGEITATETRSQN